MSTNRQLTENGVGPIPLWTARQHCARWDRFTAERFIHCIKKMDAVYRAYQAGVLDIPQVDPDSPEAQNANPARDAVRGILKR